MVPLASADGHGWRERFSHEVATGCSHWRQPMDSARNEFTKS
ncbi:hypothetical protein RISK_006782 [Rhodopirellula islandica]|uniref:Uncharacterized protein n=1 Tax=Rhodopirellula islandica TaxID=595434 RepID=A0A0J1B3L2_RHOIS|nr:hypothetical protein RISK_006782 [Rhodopirellula islandica]